MNMRLLALILLIFSTQVLATVKIEHWQTPKGSRVYYVFTDSLPMVDVQVIFDAGSARDEQQFGVAALTAAMLDTGAGKWNADTIAERFESVGAHFSAGVSNDMATVYLRTLTDKPLFDKALETMQVILSTPNFNEADFKREKNNTLAAIKQQEESPGDIASIAFANKLYGDHPYAHPSLGTKKTVSTFKASDLLKFYKNYYVAANAMVVIVGNLSRQEAETTATKLLSELPAGKKPADIPEVTLPKTASTEHIEFPSSQTHVLVGEPGMARNDPDFFSLAVGNHILGGSGLVSKLFIEIREKLGLAYHASSSFAPMLRKGPFTVGLQTRNDQTEQAITVLSETLTNYVTKGSTEAELSAAKKNITGGFAMRFDTNKKLAASVAAIGFYNLPLDYLDTYKDKINEVTVASIISGFKNHIDLSTLQTVTVGKSPDKSAK